MISKIAPVPGNVDHQQPFAYRASMPVVADAPGDGRPFCEGRFLDALPLYRPTVKSSWCEIFSQSLGLVDPVASASATAHRQLLELLARLPDSVPGNDSLQAQIDSLQLAVGAFAMGRHSAADENVVLEKCIDLTVAARRIEQLLAADYRNRWQPAHQARPRPFAELGGSAQALR